MNDIMKALVKGKSYLDKEAAKYNAMSPEDQRQYDLEQRRKNAEAERLLQQLRGPGFTEL